MPIDLNLYSFDNKFLDKSFSFQFDWLVCLVFAASDPVNLYEYKTEFISYLASSTTMRTINNKGILTIIHSEFVWWKTFRVANLVSLATSELSFLIELLFRDWNRLSANTFCLLFFISIRLEGSLLNLFEIIIKITKQKCN